MWHWFCVGIYLHNCIWQNSEYRKRADDGWKIAWQLLNLPGGWKRESGSENIIVHSQEFRNLGKVFRLEVCCYVASLLYYTASCCEGMYDIGTCYDAIKWLLKCCCNVWKSEEMLSILYDCHYLSEKVIGQDFSQCLIIFIWLLTDVIFYFRLLLMRVQIRYFR